MIYLKDPPLDRGIEYCYNIHIASNKEINMIKYNVQVLNERTEWQFNGQRHRIDGPAVEWTNGTKWWFLNGERHRVDGAAVEHASGDKFWLLNGVRVTEQEVMEPVKHMTVAQIEAMLGHRIKVIAG
jgi:hypothetical protein